MNLIRVIAPLALTLLLFSAACGGDDDDTSAPDASSNGGAAPTATTSDTSEGEGESDDDESSSSDSASDTSEGAGTVTIGDDSWTVVPTVSCEIITSGNAPTAAIEGHAEEDESIEIAIAFDAANLGLVMSIQGANLDPSWIALSETFAVNIGGTHISGEGSFSSSSGDETAEGSFDVTC